VVFTNHFFITVDALGNVYACNWKGGVFVIDPDGTHLGTIRTGHRTANCVFGGEDGKTLFITSGSRLCRIADNFPDFSLNDQ